MSTANRQAVETYLSNKWTTVTFSAPVPSNAVTVAFNVSAPPVATTVESRADGSGVVVPLQNLTSGVATNVYAIVRNSGTFLSNTVAAWSLQSITGGVVAGDLTTNGTGTMATFTANKAGSAVIQAVANSAVGQSGVQTVIAGAPSQTTVESRADGSGVTVPLQNLAAGASTNVFSIARDAQGNFAGNVAAAWSLQSLTGGVVSGDLVAAGDSKSATFTGHAAGSAVIQAVANSFTGQSGVITVTAGAVTQLIWSTQPGSATVNLPFGTQPGVENSRISLAMLQRRVWRPPSW